MAEFLLIAADKTNADPNVDVNCYKRGDVVVLRDNGWGWGTAETLPPAQGGKFCILKITDVTADQVRNWVRNNWGCEVEGADLGQRRRRVGISLSIVPASVRNALNNNGVYSNTWANIRQYVVNKLTQATASGANV